HRIGHEGQSTRLLAAGVTAAGRGRARSRAFRHDSKVIAVKGLFRGRAGIGGGEQAFRVAGDRVVAGGSRLGLLRRPSQCLADENVFVPDSSARLHRAPPTSSRTDTADATSHVSARPGNASTIVFLVGMSSFSM